MLLKVYCSSFSAVAASTYDRPFTKLGWIAWRMDRTCFQVQSITRKRNMIKCSVEVHSGKYSAYYMKGIWKLQYEFADARINCFRWQQYLSWFICFCAFKIWCCKKQNMYCFLPFRLTNVIIFVKNTSDSYSTFVGVDLDYPNSLRYNRSSWS